MKDCTHCNKQIANNSKKCKYCWKSQDIKTTKKVVSENKGLEYVESIKADYIKRILLLIVYILLSYFLSNNICWLFFDSNVTGEEILPEIFTIIFGILIIYEIISLISDLKKLMRNMYETKKNDFSKFYYRRQILGRFVVIPLVLLIWYWMCLNENYSYLTNYLFFAWLISIILILWSDFIYNYFIYPNECNTLRSTRPSMLALTCFTWAMQWSLQNSWAVMPILIAFWVFIVIKVLARLVCFVYDKIKNK